MPKKILSFILVLMLVLTPLTSAYGDTNAISDIPKENHWSYNALNNALKNGLINGYNNKINPTSNVTRAQLVAILTRAFGAADKASLDGYKDVSENDWYYSDMSKALNMGIFKGNAENKLLPQNPATRQEAFCVIARAFKLNSKNTDILNSFTDNGKIAVWAKEAFAALVENKYINGSNGRLNPNGKITLEEFAQIMDNLVKSYITKEGTYTVTSEGNVMISCPNVIIKDATIKGDLIIGDGVGNGDIAIDNTIIEGRVIARGGGQNTIQIKGNTNIGKIVICKTGSGAIRIKTENGSNVEAIYIDDGNDDVILEGSFTQVMVETDTKIVINNATVGVISIAAEGANVSVEGKSSISETQIAENATAANLNVGKDSSVNKIVSQAEGVSIGGDGKVNEVVVYGDNTAINVEGATITIAEGTENITNNGEDVSPSNNDTQPTQPTQPSQPEPKDPKHQTVKFTVTFVNWNGDILKTEEVIEGASATAPSNPTRPEDDNYTYTFSGWDKSFTNVTEDKTVKAQYSQVDKQAAKFTVTFVNWNDTVLKTEEVTKGASATAPSSPTRPKDDNYRYTFTGWDKDFSNITDNLNVKAQYSQTAINLTKAIETAEELKQALANDDIKMIEIAKNIELVENTVFNKSIAINTGVIFTIKSDIEINNTITNNGYLTIYPGNSISSATSGSAINNGKITYNYVLGGSNAADCSEIANVTGSGTISRYATIFSQEGLHDAFEKKDIHNNLLFTDFVLKCDAEMLISEYTLKNTFKIAENCSFTIPKCKTFNIEQGATLTVDGTLTIEGTLKNAGSLSIVGTCSNSGTYTEIGSGAHIGTINDLYKDYVEVKLSSELKDALLDDNVKGIMIASDIIFAVQNGESYTFEVKKPIIVNEDKVLTIKNSLDISSEITNNGTINIFADNDWRTTVCLTNNANSSAKFINNGTVKINGDLELYPKCKLENKGTITNDGVILYNYTLGANNGDCEEIQNVTGSGVIHRKATVLTQAGLQDAFERKEGNQPFFTDYYLEFNGTVPNFDGKFVMPVSEYSLIANSTFEISNATAFTIPAGSTFTVEKDASIKIDGMLVVHGICFNKGYIEATLNGNILGYINTIEGGSKSVPTKVTTEAQLLNAVENNSDIIVVDADIEITYNIDINLNLIISKDKTLTIAEGKILSLLKKNNSNSTIEGTLINKGTLNINPKINEVSNANYQLTVAFTGQLINEGSIIIDNHSSINVENEGLDSDNHGMVDNEKGIIDIRSGWIEYRDFNGNPTPWFNPNLSEAVRTYSNLTDVARELYYRQNDNNQNSDLLDIATNGEINIYINKYKDWTELQNEFNNDIDDVNALAMMLKNNILKPASEDHLYPYETVTKIQVIELVYNFAKAIIEKYNLSDINTGNDVIFYDISALNEAQKTAINYLAKAGLLAVDNEGNLNPNSLMSSVCGEKIHGQNVEFTEVYTLCNKLMSKLLDQDIVVTNIEQLNATLNSAMANKIIINGDVTLDGNMTITRNIEINNGAALRTGTYNLTIGYETEEDEFNCEYMSKYGRVIVKGTLDIPEDSTLFNLTEIRLDGGTLKVDGTYVDRDGNMVNGNEQVGCLEGIDAKLTNNNSFSNNGTVRLINCDFTNTDDYTNNGNLEVTGGSITSEDGSFHNAGEFRIEDVYGDSNNTCEFIFGNKLTYNSNKIEYIGVVTTEQGLKNALDTNLSKYNATKDKDNKYGLNYYDRIIINDDITINNSLDVQYVNLYVNTIEEWVEGEANPQIKACTLTNNDSINLKNSNLQVYGIVVNNGTINVGVVPGEELEGHEEQRGNIIVQPSAVFENTNMINIKNGEFLRYDELNVETYSPVAGKKIGEANNVSDDIIQHIAIVHDILGLKQAVAKDGQTNYTEQEYDRIEIKRNNGKNEDADIVLDENLTIDADLYIELSNGIEVPENYTLSFTGDNHYIENKGDIWVYGTLNLGSGYRLNNQSKIQVGGTQDVTNKAKFINAAVIENCNLIEVLINGEFENNGTIFNSGNIDVNGGDFTGSGDVYNEQNGHVVGVTNAISIAQNSGELQGLISSNSKNILIANNIILYADIIIPNECTVYIGKDGYRYGEIKTGDPEDPVSHTITINDGAKLVLSDGYLEINTNGKLVNNGTIEVGERGNIRINNGSSLETNTDIIVYGCLDLYDWEGRNSYITGNGKITVYNNKALFIEEIFNKLYQYQDRDNDTHEPLEIPKITPETDFATYIKSESDVIAVYKEFDDWFKQNEDGDNYKRRYAYAAMKANDVLSGKETLANDAAHHPYENLTYAYLKSVLLSVANLFKAKDNNAISNYTGKLKGTEELVPESFGWNAEVFSEINLRNEIIDEFFRIVREIINRD